MLAKSPSIWFVALPSVRIMRAQVCLLCLPGMGYQMYPLFIVLLAAAYCGGGNLGVAQTPTCRPGFIQDRQQRCWEEAAPTSEALQNLPGCQASPSRRAADRVSPLSVLILRKWRLSGCVVDDCYRSANSCERIYWPLPLAAPAAMRRSKQLTTGICNVGYVTARAYLPEQDLSRGILEIVGY